MKCLVTKGDITKIKADAIVNAANNSLLGGGGVDGAIHRAAGRGLYEECKNLGGCKTGEAKITKGYNLPSKYVIHTVGPIWHDHSRDKNIELLRMCYINCMNVARDNRIKTIAFPSISTGVYAFPKELAAETALQALSDWFNANINDEMSNIEITFVCFDDTSFNIYNGLINKYFSI